MIFADGSVAGRTGSELPTASGSWNIKYDGALKYAPNWKQLKEARAVAAKLQGA
jgi:hypothetical protein